MATFTANSASGVDMRNLWTGTGFATISSVVTTALNEYAVLLSSGVRIVYSGSGFTYTGSVPTGGTYSSIEIRSGDGATLLGSFAKGTGIAQLTAIGGSGWATAAALLGGDSTITGIGGDDWLLGGAGNETISGGSGNDTIAGLTGIDNINGQAGTDTLVINYTSLASHVSMSGGTTGSVTTSDVLNAISYQSIERFEIYTGSGNDTLRGDALADVLHGGAGADSMLGGGGDDVYVVDNAGDTVVELLGAGTDTVYYSVSGQTLAANVETGRLIAAATSMTGNGLDNALVSNDAGLSSTLSGGDGHDVFWSGSQSDSLVGDAGNDVFYTGGGSDQCVGGTGDDQFVVYDLGVTITEASGEGTDTAWVGVSGTYVLGAHVEIGRLFGSGGRLTGNTQNNDLVANVTSSTLRGDDGDDVLWGQTDGDSLVGGAGNDTIRGGGGADTCVGGTGDDSYVVLSATATVQELADQGYDIVYMGVSGDFFIGDYVEEARLFDGGRVLTGNSLANLLVGNSSGLASRLSADGGDDLVYGSTAGDILEGGTGNDTLYGLSGADEFRFTASGWGFDQIADFSAAEGDKLSMIGSGATEFAQLSITSGTNTQISYNGDVIYLFGVTSVSASDFIFS